MWRRLGAQVTVVEMLDRVAPGLDGEVAKQFQRILEKQGIVFKLGTKVLGVETKGERVQGDARAGRAAARAETLECDVVLVCDRPRAPHARARPR